MTPVHPDRPDSDSSDHSVAGDVLPRQEPDEDEDEEEDDRKKEDEDDNDDDDETGDGYEVLVSAARAEGKTNVL
jgi:hypothetical protein